MGLRVVWNGTLSLVPFAKKYEMTIGQHHITLHKWFICSFTSELYSKNAYFRKQVCVFITRTGKVNYTMAVLLCNIIFFLKHK